jgi:glutaryl-CoA dehydrogenase
MVATFQGVYFYDVESLLSEEEVMIRDTVREWVDDRLMFDGPTGGKQIQQVRLAEMLTGITQGQLLNLQLGRLKDLGTMTLQQVSLAQRANVAMACDVAREARRLLGASGILIDYHSMRHMANLESVYTI